MKLLTRSPNQCPESNTKEEGFKLEKYLGCAIIFEDVLHQNLEDLSRFSTRDTF